MAPAAHPARPHRRQQRRRPLGAVLTLAGVAAAVVASLFLLTGGGDRSPRAADVRNPRLDDLASHFNSLPRPREVWTDSDFECLGWRSTRACDPLGARDATRDRPCDAPLPRDGAGFCEVRNRSSGEVFRVMLATCSSWWWRKVPTLACRDARRFTDFSVRAARYTQWPPPLAPPPVPADFRGDDTEFRRRGIAMVAYPKVVAGVYAIVRVLRSLGCALPVEIWIDPREMPETHSVLRALVRQFSVVVRTIDDPHATKFLAKPYALYHSQFESVLFLDSDNIPLRDPTYLFESPAFVQFGTVFWPDFWRPALDNPFNVHEQSALWQLLDMPFIDMFEQESGQLLVNRSRTAAALRKLMFYAAQTPRLLTEWELVYGDKDLFRLAWLNSSTPFHFGQHLLALGGLYDAGEDLFCGLAMLQRDEHGDFVFMHRNQAKLNGRRDQKVVITHYQTFTGGNGVASAIRTELEKYHVLCKRRRLGQRMCFLLDPKTPAGEPTPYVIKSLEGTGFAELEQRAIAFSIEGRELLSEEEEAELAAIESNSHRTGSLAPCRSSCPRASFVSYACPACVGLRIWTASTTSAGSSANVPLTSPPSPPTANAAVTAAALKELGALSRQTVPNAHVLGAALAAVSQCYSVPVPSSSAGAIAAALQQLRHLLEQHRLFAEVDGATAYASAAEREALDRGLRLLWAHATMYQLHHALVEVVRAVDSLPRAIAFWKKLRRRRVRAVLQDGPFAWLLPSSERITIDEKILSLEATLEEHLKKIGMLKEQTAKSMSSFVDYEQLLDDMRSGMRLLKLTYSTFGIAAPRKGYGAFMKMDPLLSFSFELDDLVFAPGTAGVLTAEDVLASLRRLEDNLNRFARAQEDFTACFNKAMAPCRIPSKLRQRWVQVTVAALCVTTGSIWVLKNQKEFQAAAKTFREAMHEFLNEHMIEPIQAIVAEVILNQKPEIQDPGALLDAKLSLQRMLSDFVRDTNPKATPQELQRVMNDMDMSVVSLQYEKQISSALKNLMSGDIVRMLLIQVQFIKKELMVAMGAIDELMHANQLNLQLMATVPTFVVFGGLYAFTKNLFAYIYKRTSERLFYDPSEIAGFLRNSLRDIERLLNKQNRGGAQLGVRDLGFLILLLHQVRDIFETYKAFFQEEEQERFEEDLNDLIEEGLLVAQQLAVIQRMYHSHPFLQSTKLSARSLLG